MTLLVSDQRTRLWGGDITKSSKYKEDGGKNILFLELPRGQCSTLNLRFILLSKVPSTSKIPIHQFQSQHISHDRKHCHL